MPSASKVSQNIRNLNAPQRMLLPELLHEFKQRCPGGFSDERYLGTAGANSTGERNYKLAVHEAFHKKLGGTEGTDLVRTKDAPELRKRLKYVVGKAELMTSTQEQTAFNNALDSSEDVPVVFTRALLEYLAEPEINERAFRAYRDAVVNLPQVGEMRVATWPNLTLLPYIAQPDRHMFLKPQVTKDFVARLGFDLQYDTELRWVTYAALLRLASGLFTFLRPHGARDMIDVQSFIWVVMKYDVKPTSEQPAQIDPAAPSDTDDLDRLAGGGQGIGLSPVLRKKVEDFAMKLARQHFRSRHYAVRKEGAPYDLLCCKGDKKLFVEVKGTTTNGESILITRNEYEFNRQHSASLSAMEMARSHRVAPLR